MGSWASTRWEGYTPKTLVEECRKLDVLAFVRAKVFECAPGNKCHASLRLVQQDRPDPLTAYDVVVERDDTGGLSVRLEEPNSDRVLLLPVLAVCSSLICTQCVRLTRMGSHPLMQPERGAAPGLGTWRVLNQDVVCVYTVHHQAIMSVCDMAIRKTIASAPARPGLRSSVCGSEDDMAEAGAQVVLSRRAWRRGVHLNLEAEGDESWLLTTKLPESNWR